MSAPDLHSVLVETAAKWLRKKCAVVMTELTTTGEVPDAIGWQGTHSTLIECKVSRADFLADQNKFFRRNSEMGIGMHRYYLVPSGLLKPEDLPPRWGLLELAESGVKTIRKSDLFEEVNSRHEIGMLLSALRRVGHNAPKAISIRCYTIESENTATLGLAEDGQVKPTKRKVAFTFDERSLEAPESEREGMRTAAEDCVRVEVVREGKPSTILIPKV